MRKLVAICLVAGACSKSSAPPPAPVEPAKPVAAAPIDAATPPDTAATVAAPATAPDLVIGGDNGIARVGPDGKIVKQLSATPTSFPRWTPDHAALLFLSTAGELRRLDLASGKETVIAKLPDTIKACPRVTIARAKLSLQEPSDLTIAEDGKSACVILADRNENMAEASVQWQVDLATGKTVQSVMLSSCKESEAVVSGSAMSCVASDPVHPQTVPPRAPFAVVLGKLVHDGKPVATLGAPRDYGEDALSPSGAWATIRGNVQQGDYIHSDLFLFDRKLGKVYPIPSAGGPWPPALADADLAKLETWSQKTVGVVGESTIRWIGDSLLIDHLLVTPGTGSVTLDGDVAQ